MCWIDSNGEEKSFSDVGTMGLECHQGQDHDEIRKKGTKWAEKGKFVLMLAHTIMNSALDWWR